MSSSGTNESETTWISRVDRLLYWLEIRIGMISGIAIMGLMFLAIVSVGGRNLFNAPLQGYVDWIEQLMPLIAILGISYVQRVGGHIRMDIFLSRLRGRTLWAIEFITVVLILVLMLLLVWGSFAHFLRSFDIAAPLWSRDSTMDIGLPLWPVKLLVPMGFSVLCLRLLLQAWSYASAFTRNDPEPEAVPAQTNFTARIAFEEVDILLKGEPPDDNS